VRRTWTYVEWLRAQRNAADGRFSTACKVSWHIEHLHPRRRFEVKHLIGEVVIDFYIHEPYTGNVTIKVHKTALENLEIIPVYGQM
jgi:hypothetical protein